MSTVIVTGAAGFIGSNLAIHLIRQGHRVIGIDGLLDGSHMSNLDEIIGDPLFIFFRCTLGTEPVPEIISSYEPDVCIHLAAESHVDRSLNDDMPFWRTQVLGTHALFSKLVDWNTCKVVINQITDEAYGEIPRGSCDAEPYDQFWPRPPYACSKVAQYYVGRSFRESRGLPVISTFPVNNFGPRQDPEKIIPKFITNLLQDKPVPLMKSFEFERDWLPVADMCKALEILMEKGVPGSDYNIGADNHHRNIELTKKLLNLADKDESYIEFIPDRTTHDCRYAVDSTEMKRLGWKVENDFDDYLKLTFEWYKKKLEDKDARSRTTRSINSTHRVDDGEPGDI